jgi:hypothetical protein
MTEHRPILDPTILGRLAGSMAHFETAWLADLVELRRVEGKLGDTERLLNAATDRASDLQADLRTARQENSDLIKRNAHLEAQVQNLYEKSLDAQDALGNLATRAVDAARTAPMVAPRQEWKDPEKNPAGDDDGTDLPRGQPVIFQRPAHAQEPGRTRPPVNEFGRHAAQ